MTDATMQNLGRAKIQQLLAAVGTASSEPVDVPDATAYDWRDPHYYNEGQYNRLAAVMSQVSAVLAEQFAHFYGSEFDVTPSSVVQFYAADLPRHINRANMLSLAFQRDEDQLAGYMAIEMTTALDWGMRLLGDTETEDDPNRSLSSLEESLLTDLAGAVGRAFADSIKNHVELEAAREMANGCPDLDLESTEAICKIVFQVKRIEPEPPATTEEDETEAEAQAQEETPQPVNVTSEAIFVFPCPVLAALAGKDIEKVTPPPQDQLTKILMAHVQKIPVNVTARLAATRLSFTEVLDLAPDDILLLDKPIDEFVDVIVDDQTVFRGRPAQSEGQYAVYITERMDQAEPINPLGAR